jgi:hypothetical protein
MAAQLVRTRETSGSAKLKKGPDTQLENCQPYRHKNRWQAKTSTTNYHGGGSVATLGKEGLGGGSNSRALIMLHRVWYQSGSFSYSNVCVLCVCVCVCVCARAPFPTLMWECFPLPVSVLFPFPFSLWEGVDYCLSVHFFAGPFRFSPFLCSFHTSHTQSLLAVASHD